MFERLIAKIGARAVVNTAGKLIRRASRANKNFIKGYKAGWKDKTEGKRKRY